jgi:hypothetical protein
MTCCGLRLQDQDRTRKCRETGDADERSGRTTSKWRREWSQVDENSLQQPSTEGRYVFESVDAVSAVTPEEERDWRRRSLRSIAVRGADVDDIRADLDTIVCR